ncbi:stage II sporulation protein P [Pelosinus sp. sgz500959]|uniref:stage II sporulation protein P n=1 Tax=Pelosinus sp. sgz500959 TaxID=3242472 RepID=UPI00366D3D42
MSKIWRSVIVLLVFCSMLTPGYTQESMNHGYFSFVDENGHVVYITGWEVRVGDQCITENNKRFEVVSIEGEVAHVKLLGEINMSQYEQPSNQNLLGMLQPRLARAQGRGKVAFYHTHSDESYVPTDGKESILGAGGIYKVGDAFASALKTNGMEVIQSNAKHDPHDNMAYERSRRTVVELLKQQPDAIFDIHRDATPPEVYQTTINGEDVSKLQLVVGKYGATGKQIEDYALQIKAASDKQHPGLIKGIFFAKGGDYNQDLFPKSMLLEVGSHTNSRQSAEKGIALFADVIPTILGKTGASPAAAPDATAGETGLGTADAGPSGASKSIGWMVGIFVVGIAAFLFLSTGSMKEAKAKLKQFTTTEFANFFGPSLKRKNERKKTNNEKDKD